MLDPSSPDTSASPAPSSPPSFPPRYAYLVGRLRNRQITMEEATELFGIMESMLRSSAAFAAPAARAAPSAPPAPAPRRAAPTSAAAPSALAMTDENVALALLALGAGSGLLAAVMKRAQEGPRAPSPPVAASDRRATR